MKCSNSPIYLLSAVLLLLLFLCSLLDECTGKVGVSHACQRTCEWPPQPKTCTYKWKVEWFYSMGDVCSIGCDNSTLSNDDNVGCQQHPECFILDGVSRPVNVVNRQLPGPSIQVCEGDVIIVDVYNDMDETEAEGTTIHWHGILQHMNPYMDGVAMITQCPIEFQQTFTYEFEAHPPGTHWWHSHAGLQRADGLFGSIVIRQPVQSDPHSHLYDYDLPEHVIIVTDWYHQTAFQKLSEYVHSFGDLSPDTILLLNGKGQRIDGVYREFAHHEIFHVSKGHRYRFRAIDAGIAACHLHLSIDGHVLLLISTDGNPIGPYNVTSMVLHSADRNDFIVHADKDIGNYWLRVEGGGDCVGYHAYGILHYGGADQEIPLTNAEELAIPDAVFNKCIDAHLEDYIGLMDLDYIGIFATPQEPDVTHHISARIVHPAPGLIPTFNWLAFKKPPSPLLYQWRDVNPEDFCHMGNFTHCNETRCDCIQTIKVKFNEVVELVFLNADDHKYGITRCHPIHIHGHTFTVVAQQALKEPITMEEFKERDMQGLVPRKLEFAPRKDSVHIPHFGYLIVRFVANNPGWWFLHCHTMWHQALGMSLVIQYDEEDEIPAPPVDFPRCGSWTPPDAQHFKAGAATVESGSNANAKSDSILDIKQDSDQLDIPSNKDFNLGLIHIIFLLILSLTFLGVVILLCTCIIRKYLDIGYDPGYDSSERETLLQKLVQED